jgi:hypothetical protein
MTSPEGLVEEVPYIDSERKVPPMRLLARFLMIIYLEDLADQGLTSADVAEGGKARDRCRRSRRRATGGALASFSIKD